MMANFLQKSFIWQMELEQPELEVKVTDWKNLPKLQIF